MDNSAAATVGVYINSGCGHVHAYTELSQWTCTCLYRSHSGCGHVHAYTEVTVGVDMCMLIQKSQ